MGKKRVARNASFKAKIAIEAVRERSKVSEIAKRHKIHPTQIHQWRRKLLDDAESIFSDGRSKQANNDGKELAKELFKQIGRLKMENEWLKKNLPSSIEARRTLINRDRKLSIRQQCELLGLARSSYYYEPATESDINMLLMRLIDKQHLNKPFFGSRQMRMSNLSDFELVAI